MSFIIFLRFYLSLSFYIWWISENYEDRDLSVMDYVKVCSQILFLLLALSIFWLFVTHFRKKFPTKSTVMIGWISVLAMVIGIGNSKILEKFN